MIYVHVPFCRSFCTYCGFYSETAGKDDKRFQPYAGAVVSEVTRRSSEIAATLGVNTLYIGGGTPSVLPLSCLRAICSALPYGPYDEFTVEVNPEDIVEKGEEYVIGLKSMGVSRVSMGVQSFDDGILRWMHRRHNAETARRAFRIIRESGIENVSIDLIFGISGMTDGQWEATIENAVHIGDGYGGRPQHISAYQLSVERGSALEGMVNCGRYREAPDEDCARQYRILCEKLAQNGYRHYEVSNFALPGFEAKHNSAYWRRVPYVGLGAGAHSFDGKRRSWNTELDADGRYSSESEILTDEDARVEKIMLSLRTAEGVDAGWLQAHCAEDVTNRLVAGHALVHDGPRLRIPEDRFFVSDEIIRELI